jgi:AcrR family transcriptional regulator
MSSLRNTSARSGLDRSDRPAPVDAQRAGEDALLDAARASIVAVGWRRSTLTDVARRAGVSRMTLYRRWPDMSTLLADLMTREWSGLVQPRDQGEDLEQIAAGVAASVAALRENELFDKIVRVDPELLLPYLLERRGRTQDALLTVLEAGIAAGQRAGTVRAGEPTLLARSVLLATYGFGLSADTMTDERYDVGSLDGQLRELVERYLRP